MANVFVKAEKLASTAVALLKKDVGVAGIFTNRYGVADFAGSKGDVVGVKRPAVLAAREKAWRGNDSIIVDELINTKIQVVLNKHPYNAVELTAEETTLDEIEYVRDVQVPQVEALTAWYENLIVSTLRNATYVNTATYDLESSNEYESSAIKVAANARRLFQKSHVPAAGRFWLVGADVAASIASTKELEAVDTSGLPEALREGVVGRLKGINVVELDYLNDEESYFVHSSALAIANVAPVIPPGVVAGGSSSTTNGFAVTQLWDYSSDKMNTRSVVHSFAGANVIEDPKLKADGTLDLDVDGAPKLQFVRGIKVTFKGNPFSASV